MRGYLQRIAASVARPERTVHPLVGGIFLDQMKPPIGEVSSMMVAHTQPPPAERSANAAIDAPVTRETVTADRNADAIDQPILERGPTVEATGFGLLVPQNPETHKTKEIQETHWRRDEVSPRERPAMQPARNNQAAEVSHDKSSHESAPAEDHPAMQPLRVQSLPVSDISPVLHAELRDTLMGRDERQTPPPRQLVPEKMERAESQRAIAQHTGPQRNSERDSRSASPPDIQIHIGRIEVIAVPPPVQRAASSPGRKAVSLDEYLKRRDGRA